MVSDRCLYDVPTLTVIAVKTCTCFECARVCQCRCSPQADLTRIYGPDILEHHDFSTILSSVAFAGTVVGMLVFGASHNPPTKDPSS